MLRKTLLALVSAAALGAAAFTPTAASAHHFGGFGHFGHWGPGIGFGFYGTDDADAGDCYLVRKATRYGYRLVTVCD